MSTTAAPPELTINDLIRTIEGFRTQHGQGIKGLRMSRLTSDFLMCGLPILNMPSAYGSIWGVPLTIDSTVPFGEYRIINA